ncbi:MAG: [Fe-Fe] hydrogenase large subunit C-terminal domain-containing protein [Anaerotruncus massiliensis (ex Togo et al. 2019)]
MATFQELYQTLLAAQARSNLPEAIKYIRTQQDFDPKQLDCLLNPQKHPLVWRTGECCASARARANAPARSTRSIPRPKRAGGSIDVTRCVGCSACIDACAAKKLEASRRRRRGWRRCAVTRAPSTRSSRPPSWASSPEAVTPGMLRSAFLRLGFDGMIEVALFADIPHLKEALEFDKNITREGDFQLTSCCCPCGSR